MADQQKPAGSPSTSVSRRLANRWWLGPVILLVVFFIGLGIWLMPRRSVEFVSVDGQHRWNDEEAPPRRKVVWQPAVPAKPLAAAPGVKDSEIRPQLADDGNTLYFTLRAADDSKDIYRSRLVDGQWQAAEPVAELNTEADDIGPVIQADGQVLYLYSNREDSYGGFDLYVSHRTDDGWSKPVNLGSKVNSPAHEYDPAVAADGRTLYFSSNRSPRMHRLITEGKYKDRADQWRTTLRADLGLNKFDIYRATRESADAAWLTAAPLDTLNRDESNEGAPYVAPDDAFLYFVSDRAHRPGEETNFDIFRARIRGAAVDEVENLGPGVNTPQNELEPALAVGGFKIYFSRNLEQAEAEQQYALYSSTAVEIEEQVTWDDSNWQAFTGWASDFLANNWWWIVLALLVLALLAAIVWFLRNASLRRLPIPTFFLLALLLHLFFVPLAYVITFGDGIFADIRKKIKEVVVAQELTDPDPSNQPEQEAFNEISEQLSIDTVETPQVPRQTTEAPNVPVPTETAMPQVKIRKPSPSEVNRQTADQPQLQPRKVTDPLLRRQQTLEEIAQSQVELETTEAQQTPEQQIQPEQVAVNRQQITPQLQNAPRIPRRTIDPAIEVAQEKVEAERTENQPTEVTPTQPQQLNRQALAKAELPDSPKVATEQLQAVQSPTELKAASQAVDVERSLPVTQPVTTPNLPRRAVQPDPARPTIADVEVERINPAAPQQPAPAEQQPQLARAETPTIEPVTPAEVQTEQLNAPAAKPKAESAPARVDVDINRQSPTGSDVAAPQLTRRTPTANPDLQLAAAEVAVERIADEQPSAASAATEAVPNIERTAVALAQPEASEIATENIGAAPSMQPAALRPIGSPAVAIQRQETGDVAAPTAAAPQVQLARASIQPGALDVAVERIEVSGDTPAASDAAPNPLASRSASEATPIAAATIETAELSAPAGSPTQSLAPRREAVAVERTTGGGPAAQATPLGIARLPRTIRVEATAADIGERIAEAAPAASGATEVEAQLARANTSLEKLGAPDDEAILTETPGVVRGQSPEPTTTEAVGVTVGRQSDDARPVTTGSLQVAGAKAPVGLPRQTGLSDLAPADAAPAGEVRGAEATAQLTKASLVDGQAAAEAIAPDAPLAEGESSAEQQITGVDVEISRDDGLALALNITNSENLGGPHRADDPRLSLGSLTRENVDAPLAVNPRGTPLVNRPARPKPVLLFAEDNIGLQALLRLRQTDEAAKKDLIQAFGGGDQTLDAIRRGLMWLATQQHEDGRWRLNEFKPVNGQMPNGQGNQNCDTAATGFALVPFLGDGNTPQHGKYKDTVAKGIRWLVEHQQPSGELTQGNEGNARMYGHGIATIALCEAFALSYDAALRDPAQRAVDFIVAAQSKEKGGWRYHPGNDSDTSVVGWQIMALKSAQMADLNVPQATLDGARRWLDHVAGKGDNLGRFGYTSAGDLKNAMTAEGLLCLEYLGTRREDSVLQMGAQYLLKNLPKTGKDNSYYWYYGTQVMYHMQGDFWKQWNDAFSPMLLESQHRDGHMAGTWDPNDQWEKSGGRIFSTSLRVLMLEVYYRHLPLYQVLEQ